MEDQRIVVPDLDQFCQLFLVLLDVDHPHGVVAEHTEEAIEA